MIVCARPPDTELDLLTAPALARSLAALDGGDDVVVDMRSVTFCDARGLDALLEGWRRQEAAGGSLHMAGLAPGVRDVLTLGGMRPTCPDLRGR